MAWCTPTGTGANKKAVRISAAPADQRRWAQEVKLNLRTSTVVPDANNCSSVAASKLPQATILAFLLQKGVATSFGRFDGPHHL